MADQTPASCAAIHCIDPRFTDATNELIETFNLPSAPYVITTAGGARGIIDTIEELGDTSKIMKDLELTHADEIVLTTHRNRCAYYAGKHPDVDQDNSKELLENHTADLKTAAKLLLESPLCVASKIHLGIRELDENNMVSITPIETIAR